MTLEIAFTDFCKLLRFIFKEYTIFGLFDIGNIPKVAEKIVDFIVLNVIPNKKI
jgi:hypothetical protein